MIARSRVGTDKLRPHNPKAQVVQISFLGRSWWERRNRRTYPQSPLDSELPLDALKLELRGMSREGRGRVERRLQEMRALGIPEIDQWIAHFVAGWKEVRAYRFAERWLKERPISTVFSSLILCLYKRPWRALPLYLDELARPDLPDHERDILIDHLYGILHRVESHPRYAEGWQVLVEHLHHSSPEVRWTAVFCLAYNREYREQIATLVDDETLSTYGYVSRIAKNALRIADGESDLDLNYGSASEARANGAPVLR